MSERSLVRVRVLNEAEPWFRSYLYYLWMGYDELIIDISIFDISKNVFLKMESNLTRSLFSFYQEKCTSMIQSIKKDRFTVNKKNIILIHPSFFSVSLKRKLCTTILFEHHGDF